MSVHEIITDRVVARIEEAIKTGERFRWCKPFTGGAISRKGLIISCTGFFADSHSGFGR